MKKKLLLVLLALFFFTGCGNRATRELVKQEGFENPVVTMTIEGYGEIKIELLPQYAFNTVANFISLVESGFYDGNVFNRVDKGFVLQGGGKGATDYSIKGEFESNGVKNDLKHTEGVVSLARAQKKDSGCSQFFIMLADNASLDGNYAAFGKVIEGMDIVHQIENKTYSYIDEDYHFLEPSNYITITKATVDTKGYTYKVDKIKY